jgi:HSP20 family molecular chaperone IbpA
MFNFTVKPPLSEDLTDGDNWLPELFVYDSLDSVSILEDGENIYVEAAIPKIDPKAVYVTFNNGILWVRSRINPSYLYMIPLPKGADQSEIPQVECQNGLINVTFAKSSKTHFKKLQ